MLLSVKLAGSRSDTLEESLCVFLVCLANVFQQAFVCRVESPQQLVQGVLYPTWEGISKIFKLAIHPPEPT